MKYFLVTLFVLAYTSLSVADKAGPIKQSYEAKEIASNVYVIHGPKGLPSPFNQGFMNNPGFIVTATGVVVIDPGSSVQAGEMVLSHISRITDKPVVAVFNTHIHGDHWLGNQAIRDAYPKAALYGHPNLIQEIADGAGDSWLDTMLTMTEGATAGTVVIAAEKPVDHGTELNIGGITFRILHLGKAHTNTDIMIYAVEPSIVFLGDNAGNDRLLRLVGGNMAGNIASLNATIALEAKYYVPGHGQTGGLEVPVAYRDYLQTIYSGVEKYFEEGLSDYEIKPLLLPKMAQWQHWTGFEESFGKHLNTAYLEIEASAF